MCLFLLGFVLLLVKIWHLLPASIKTQYEGDLIWEKNKIKSGLATTTKIKDISLEPLDHFPT